MGVQFWVDAPIACGGPGPAVTGTAEASLLMPESKASQNGNYFKAGRLYECRASGQMSNIVTTPGTLTFRLKWGAAIIAASQAIQLNTTAQTNVVWNLDLQLSCRAAGSVANFMLVGFFESVSAGAVAALGRILIPLSAPAVGSNIDVTSPATLDLTAQFSLTGNSIQLMLGSFKHIGG